MFSDKSNFLYISFLSWALKDVVQVNKLFQTDKADPLKLMEDLNALLLKILSVLIPPIRLGKVSGSELINFKFEDYIMDTNLMNFGYSFNATAVFIEKNDLDVIRIRCKEFLIELCRQIQTRVPENMSVLENLTSFTPELAVSLVRQPDVTNIAATFSTLCGDIDSTMSEWKCLPRVQWINVQNSEDFWVEVANNSNAAGEPRYRHISSLAVGLLSLPFSNATVERAFSIINIVKDKLRNRLSVTSVDSIMRTRWSLFNNLEGCSSFEPSDQMLQRFNSEKMYETKKENVDIIEIFSEIP